MGFPKIKRWSGVILAVLGWVIGFHPVEVRGQGTEKTDSSPGLVIHQDSRITQVVEKRKDFIRKSSWSNMGYRLLIYAGNKRQDVYAHQAEFKRSFPELETYITYAFPNFKLVGGDFRTREDALKVSDQLKLERGLNPILLPQKIDLTKAYKGNL